MTLEVKTHLVFDSWSSFKASLLSLRCFHAWDRLHEMNRDDLEIGILHQTEVEMTFLGGEQL